MSLSKSPRAQWKGKKMMEDDRLEEISGYVRKTYRWVVVIGVITILTVLLSFCAALFSAST